MTVLDREHNIYAFTAGDLQDSFYEAIDRAEEVFCVNIPERADIVISAAPYPMDIDLYQSQYVLRLFGRITSFLFKSKNHEKISHSIINNTFVSNLISRIHIKTDKC